MGVRGTAFRASGIALATGALALAACASPLLREDGAYVNRERGYGIAVPPGSWRPVDLEAADLAFRGPGGALMSLASRCGTPLAKPEVLARNLVIGVTKRRVLAEGAVTLDRHPGWASTYEVEIDGLPHYLKTVTVVVDRCVYDWALLAEPDSQEAERDFDRWWASFRIGGEAAQAAGGP